MRVLGLLLKPWKQNVLDCSMLYFYCKKLFVNLKNEDVGGAANNFVSVNNEFIQKV